MASTSVSGVASVNRLALSTQQLDNTLVLPDEEKRRIEDVGFLTAMTLVMLGNYAQTGHFGGPLAYTPYTVTTSPAWGRNEAGYGSITGDLNIPTPTNSCWLADTTPRSPTPCG